MYQLQAELDFQQLFESVPGLYLILQTDLRIVAVSDAYLNATMTRREEITGRGIFEVFPDNPDDPGASGVSNLRASLEHVLQKKEPHTMAVQQYDIRRPDGSFEERFWSPLNKPLLDENKEIRCIIHRVEDVTSFVKLKKQEALQQQLTQDMQLRITEMEGEIYKRAQEIQVVNTQLRAEVQEREHTELLVKKQKQEIQDFIDSMSTLCAKLSTDGSMLMVNKTAMHATGLSMESLLAINFLEGAWWTFDPVVQQRVANAFKKACEGIAINYDEKISIFGQVLNINFSLMPILNLEGTGVDYIVAEGRDISSLKQIEQSLQQKTEELQNANAELEAFSYSVSHDLRAPLRIIDGYTEIIVSDYGNQLDEEGRRMLGIVTGNVRKMGQLIDDLLNLSRLGRKELLIHLVDMNKLIEPVIGEQVFIKGRNIAIDIGKLEPADCDSSLIRQVWINLMSNAVKYSSEREKPHIDIRSERTKTEIIYQVKDNGVGFNMRYADKLFGVFQRLHKMNEFEGTGVGLALVHRIVTRHGGRVWAEAEVDKGACFYFSLPLKPVNN